jgi:hypothetical protein
MTRPNIRSISWLAAVALLSLLNVARGQALVEAGVPALSREWTSVDYQQAANVLASGKVPLPTLADPEGRAFLKRLTSTDNLSSSRNRSVPIGARLEDFSKMMIAPNSILKQYLAAANKGEKLHAEIALQMAFVLHLAEEGILLADEFMPTIPKDGKYETRLAGLKKMNSGLTTIFVGAEASLGENTFYSQEDLSGLLQAMADVLPTVKRAFLSDYKIELRKKLQARQASFSDQNDAANLKKMIAELSQ